MLAKPHALVVMSKPRCAAHVGRSRFRRRADLETPDAPCWTEPLDSATARARRRALGPGA